jgi:heat shock protein HslJ
MSKKNIWILGGLVLLVTGLVIVVTQIVFAQNQNEEGKGSGTVNVTDPHMLLIPRWFLFSLIVDGKEYAVPEQKMNLQFGEGNQANGLAGCNNFRGSYLAGKDGGIGFDQLISTKMACKGVMEQENAYLQALSQVKLYHFDQGKLILSSLDGKTSLVFVKPPK